MTFKDQLQSSGSWLFRYRSYIPLILLPLATLVIFFSDDFPQAFALRIEWKLFCFCVSLSGMLIRALVVGLTPSGTSGRNTSGQIAESLNTEGIYSVVRHPLYLGNYIVILGIVLWTGIWWFVILTTVLYWIYYERIIFTEEEYLASRFGTTFQDWTKHTPAVIPSFKHYRPNLLSFSIKNVLAREYDGLLAICTAFCILELLEYLEERPDSSFNMFWFALFIGTFVLAALLRWMRKHTSLLQVSGR